MTRKVFIYVFTVLFMLVGFPLKSAAQAVSKVTIKELIVKHSIEMGLDPAIALSIAKAESGFCHEKKRSKKMENILFHLISQLPPTVVAFIAGYIAAKITSKIKIILLAVIVAIMISAYNMIIL